MTRDSILTIGELEPERPTITVNRNAPDGPWQAFKHRHFDVLLRWFPVRYAVTSRQYPLRLPSEFGLATIAKIQRFHAEYRDLTALDAPTPAQIARASHVMRETCYMILDAPRDVIDSLSDMQRLQVLLVFPSAATGQKPAPIATENPPTSEASSPASAGSIPATPGPTG